jgi:transposase-like protein
VGRSWLLNGFMRREPMPPTCTICQHPERLDIEADLRDGTSYRDIARRHDVSKDALSRHRANHMSRLTPSGLTAAREIITLLDKAETSRTWSSTVLAVREARRYVEELMTLNLTVPASRAVAPDANAK